REQRRRRRWRPWPAAAMTQSRRVGGRMSHVELVEIGVDLGHRQFSRDRDAVVERSLAAGGTRLVVTGTSPGSSRAALGLAREDGGPRNADPGGARRGGGVGLYHRGGAQRGAEGGKRVGGLLRPKNRLRAGRPKKHRGGKQGFAPRKEGAAASHGLA